MSPLLSLPRELRDTIIDRVLSSARLAPPTISSAESNRCAPPSYEGPQDPGFDSWPYGQSHVRFEQPAYISNSYPLFLTNHQLAAETASALRRLSLPYELDVMQVDEAELWPTWLSVPVLTSKLDVVNVTFRATGFAKKRSMWKRGCGAPPYMLWCFYYLLEHVLKRGPVGKTSASWDREVSIKTLNLNFVGNNHVSPGDPSDSRDIKYTYSADPDENTNNMDLRPEWVADFLDSELWGLLGMGNSGAAYGKILHERVGSIQFMVNGETKENLNLTNILHELNPTSKHDTFGHVAPEERLSAFWKWKEETARKRMELGFLGVGDEDLDEDWREQYG
ncbi:uncharacterized protein BDZ99DRAFT_469329 [Mytilinidion resinicola]|uniref:Uncharacterized protein n=1 Tax=Mytilinidion resinicola TaxID=574789 RepID=A0A6A6Y1B9_9PEZI|nr:uncharacterized protein BDZ99DRAFT_469329 [Mytilinidion resinicola]KAF2801804.1 hypothetical protein BDZ99DRAFT_469329 [Mytilinidion resinicola]